MTATATETGLAARMRTGSQAEHNDAESSVFMNALLKGEVNETGYAEYLVALRPVYEALEKVGCELAVHPVVGALIDAGLERLSAIDVDLEYWAPAGAPSFQSEAVENYVARVNATLNDPVLYVAHHYTRYLGDLSGGQAIGKLLGRAFDIDDKSGLSLYEFPAIDKPKPFKDGYRLRLDELDVSEEDRARIVEEVRVAFSLNSAVFAELGRNMDRYQR
jgi:heme oxygenase